MWSHVYLSIELATDFSLYLDTNLQSPACIWIEDWRFHRNSFLKSSTQSAGGLTIRRRNPVESSIWRGKGFHPSTHSIPFHPSVHPIHPPILSIHPFRSSTYLPIAIRSPICLSTYISTNLSFDPSNCILSYNVAILGLHVDWRSKKELSSVQRRVQGVPTTRSIEKPFSRHARQPVFKQFKPTIKQNCTGFDTY